MRKLNRGTEIWIRTWWCNKLQPIGLLMVLGVTVTLVAMHTPSWFLPAWLAYVAVGGVTTLIIMRKSSLYQWKFWDGVGFIAASVPFLWFAFWSPAPGVLVAAVVSNTVLTVTGHGLHTFRSYFEMERRLQRENWSIEEYVKVSLRGFYCSRTALRMFMRDRFGVEASRDALRNIRSDLFMDLRLVVELVRRMGRAMHVD